MSKNIEEAVALQHLFPEVGRAITGWMLRVSSAALHFARMAAPIERQKMRSLLAQARGHVDFVRVGGEVYQGTGLESKQWRARVAVGLILIHRTGEAPARVERLDLSTGKRVLFKELAPPSRAGVLVSCTLPSATMSGGMDTATTEFFAASPA